MKKKVFCMTLYSNNKTLDTKPLFHSKIYILPYFVMSLLGASIFIVFKLSWNIVLKFYAYGLILLRNKKKNA
jgi:hypothetical protein